MCCVSCAFSQADCVIQNVQNDTPKNHSAKASMEPIVQKYISLL